MWLLFSSHYIIHNERNDNMVYLVCLCNYEYEIVEGYFTDEAKAYEYCDSHNEENEYYNDLKYYVKVVKELK